MLLAILCTSPAAAQGDDNPVYVDDSPRAWELFRRAGDQAKDNPGEAARLYQELLDRYAHKLIPVSEADPDLFTSVRRRVHEQVLAQPGVLERYRSIESAEGERLLAAGETERLMRTRFLTASALEATIRAAQEAIEDDRFWPAIRLLLEAADHPDLEGRRAAYRWFFLGLAAGHVGEADLHRHAQEALAQSPAPEAPVLHGELLRLSNADPLPEETRGLTVLDVAPQAELEGIVSRPIWSVELQETLFRRRNSRIDFNEEPDDPALEAVRRTGEFLTAAPTVAAQRVYINEGQVIRAFDRFSQREFWQTKVGRDSGLALQRGNNEVGDMNIVAASGGALVTITGHAVPSMRVGTDKIVCLDAESGETRWEISLDRLGGKDEEEYEGLFAHGAPYIADDTVYVLARKVPQRPTLVSTYVVALDLNPPTSDGRVRWIQYISSSGSMQQSDVRPFSTIAGDRGEVFVATSLGAVACVDARGGEVRWLKRVESRFRLMPGTPPWEISSPLLTRRGVIARSPDQRFIFLLDRETGTELERHDAIQWGSPRYLLTDGEMIFAIGDEIAAIPIDALAAPLWQINSGRSQEEYYDLRGRVQVAGETLVAPTQRGLILIDTRNGSVTGSIEMEAAANPLALGRELYVAHNDSLEAYMPIAVAERMLREQLEQAPADPAPALSLLRIASRTPEVGQAASMAIEAADAALAAIERMADPSAAERARGELFSTLVQLAYRLDSQADDAILALHGKIGAIARNPEERIDHHLAKGAWLTTLARERDRSYLAQAIETYQQVLSDSALFVDDRRNDDVIRPASSVAMIRLSSILEEFGRASYAPFAADAQRRFDRMTAGDPQPEDLIELAGRFPFATASREAAILAAHLLAERGQARNALQVLNHQYAASLPGDDRRLIVSRIVELCADAGWPRLGGYWVRESAALSQPKPPPGRRGDTPEQWLEVFGPWAIEEKPPPIGRFTAEAGERVPGLPGRIIPVRDAAVDLPTDYALILNESELARVDGAGLEVRWRTTLPDRSAELLDCTGGRIVLHLSRQGNEILVLDAATGAELWRSGELAGALHRLRVTRETARPSGHLEVGDGRERVDPFEAIPLAGPSDVISVGRTGGMARFDLSRPPDEPLWQRDHPLMTVHFAARHDLAVVLAGVVGDETSPVRLLGRIVLIDPETGEVFASHDLRNVLSVSAGRRPAVAGLPRAPSLPHWLAVSPRGLAVVGTGAAVEAVDLASGGRAWINLADDAQWLTRAWVGDNVVMAADPSTRVQAIDPLSGRLSAPFQPRRDRIWQPRELRDIQFSANRIVAQYEGRIVWFDENGRVVGQDQIVDDREFVHLVPAADSVIAISHGQSRGVPEFRRRRAPLQYETTIWLLSHNGRIESYRQIDAQRVPPVAVVVIDGWILVSDQLQTVAIPISG